MRFFKIFIIDLEIYRGLKNFFGYFLIRMIEIWKCFCVVVLINSNMFYNINVYGCYVFVWGYMRKCIWIK